MWEIHVYNAEGGLDTIIPDLTPTDVVGEIAIFMLKAQTEVVRLDIRNVEFHLELEGMEEGE